jgi:hypothetical protein
MRFYAAHVARTVHTRHGLDIGGYPVGMYSARETLRLRGILTDLPPSVVATLSGFSYTCTQRHAHLAAQPWS